MGQIGFALAAHGTDPGPPRAGRHVCHAEGDQPNHLAGVEIVNSGYRAGAGTDRTGEATVLLKGPSFLAIEKIDPVKVDGI
jgi:hypothetical protein